MALDPQAMDAAVLANLRARTGRDQTDWIAALDAAGPFAKPAQAIAWLKAQGMGHVTAQVLVRHWQPAAPAPTVGSVLGSQGAELLFALVARLGPMVPGLRVGVRKGYVTLGTGVQFAVAVAGREAPGIRLGLVAQAPGPALPPAPPMGGSGRFRLLLDVPEAAAIDAAIAHLHAAATA